MLVIIAGGGRNGTELAKMLIQQNHQVRVIEHRPDVLARLHSDLPTEVIYEGDPTLVEVQEEGGMGKADVVAACLADDVENLTVCFLAREKFNVKRTVARVNNPRNAWLFDEKFHVDSAIDHSQVMAQMIQEEMSLGDMVTLLKLSAGDYFIVEEKIPPGARAIGVPLKDLGLPETCVIAGIIRNKKVVVPRGASAFEAGDEVLALADRKGADFLASLFVSPD